MKKILLLAGVALVSLTSLQAQEFRFGAKAGVNFANQSGDDTEFYKNKTGFHIGGFVEIPLTDKFSVQPELLYSAQGAKIDESEDGFSFEAKYKMDYINIPIMAKYYIIEGLSVEAGPQVGVLVSAKAEVEESFMGESDSEEFDFKDESSTLDLGIGVGAAYRLTNGLFFSARYVLGLSNVNDFEGSDDYKQQNRVIQLSVGFAL